MPRHSVAAPVIDHGGAADRLRNHLRRRAITRPGRIEGDLYFLPYVRVAGLGPEGETGFHLLAAEVGDARLHRANLPPADLKPHESFAAPAGARVVQATRGEAELRALGASLGWQVGTLEDRIHYPFWLMRIEDCGRQEGAWIDAVEGRLIHHTMKVPRPVPSLRTAAVMLAPPATLAAAGALLFDRPAVALTIAVAASAVWAPVLAGWLRSRVRRERGR